MNKPLIIAHRGASGSAPENTLAAINKALEIGVDMIEIDIHQTSDNHLVVIHDATLDRTTSGKGAVKEQKLAQIKTYDAGSWYGEEFKNERVPTLKEVMQLINGKTKLLIEIKGEKAKYIGLEEQLVKEIKELNAEDWCVIQSFHFPFLNAIHNIEPHLPLYQLIVGDVSFLPAYIDDGFKFGSLNKFNCFQGINPSAKFASKRFITNRHKDNKKVFVWTVNDEKTFKRLRKNGVDGIITNYPGKMKKLL